SNLNKVGYLYDCSVIAKGDPFKVGNMWELPLHIMDGHILYGNRRWQTSNLQQSKEATMRIIDEAHKKKLRYLTVLFHDLYFCEGFKTWKEWYIWLITYIRDNNFEFISYKEAIKEMERLNG
ncbi:MAG: hypothetical protein AB1499_17340, partial [Nitrospirota bacterium]